MADAKYAMPDGSYPINTCSDVSDAAKLAHHSKTYSFAQVKAHVTRAKAGLGCSDEVLPDTWKVNDAPGDSEKSQMTDERDSFRSTVLETTGNGRTLEGLVIPYGQFAEIHDHMGDYQEQIASGAFTEALRTAKPRMFFEHGKDVRLGRTPIGSFERVWEEQDGIHARGQLFNNQLVQPLIDAARSGDLSQWSVHYRTRKDGSDESWTRAKGWDIRTVNHVRQLPEISLVNFGAYQTTVSVRSLDQLTGRSDAGSADGGEPEGERESKSLSAMQARDRELRIRGIIRG